MNVLYASHGRTIHDELFLDAFHERSWPCVHVQIPTTPSAAPLSGPSQFFVPCIAPPGTTQDAHGLWLANAASAAREILADVRPDIVLAGPIPSVTAAFAWADAQNLVALSWGSDVLMEAERAEWLRDATRDALRAAVAAVGDCRAVRERMITYAPKLADRFLTIPWGIDIDRFRPGAAGKEIRQRLAWQDSTVLLSTRRFEPGYAIDVLIDAFAAVAERVPKVRLLLCGDGSQREPLLEQIGHLGLADRIFLPGPVSHDQLFAYFQAADLYVSSALSDGSSVSLLEAMATGLPAVVTAGYGNADWITDRENGWLFPAGDAGGLARTLIAAIEKRDGWAQMGTRNRAVAVERADWKSNRERLYAFLQAVPD